MSMTMTTLGHGDFAAEIRGIQLDHTLDDDTFSTIQDAIDRYAVLVFRDQRLTDEQQVAFSERFGPLEIPLAFDQYAGVHPKVTRLSNVGDDNQVMLPDSHHATYLKGNQLWHTDSSFKPAPAKYSILHGREVPPEGGNTEFADCRAAWDDWTASSDGVSRDELEDLICEHSIIWSRSLIIGDFFTDEEKARMPPVHQRLIRSHPTTGRKSIYAGSHASHVLGWPLEKGRQLIRELNDWCTQAQYCYSHHWQPNDLLMWDNRSVLHRGMSHPPQYRRVMHRTTVQGIHSSVAEPA